jgi:hypothetical protein
MKIGSESFVHLPKSSRFMEFCLHIYLFEKILNLAAPENCIFFINWGMATDIKRKDYILYKELERK